MNKSRRGLIHSFKVIAGGLVFLLSPLLLAELPPEQQGIFEAAKKRSQTVDLGDLINNIDRQQSRGQALIDSTVNKSAEIAMSQGKGKEEAEQRAKALCKARTRYIFASRSLGKQALSEIFAEASANPELTVVFQGIPKGTKMPKGFLDLQQLASQYDPTPSIALNPLMFQRHDVTAVPEMMALTEGEWVNRECRQDIRTRVAGITSMRYLESHLDEGDLGQRGPVQDVSEPNLMDTIAQRISEVDWDEKKKKAIENVWNNVPMYPLPPATENRIIRIDPTVQAQRDILDAQGKVLVTAGTRINPLDIHSFNSIVIVFNPLRESELEVAKKMVKNYVAQGQKVIPVLSEIDKTEGWAMYNSVARSLDHRVYMLSPDLKQRFHIMRTLSVVRASDGFFEVREIKTDM
ncbi:TrbC family F-type conjugative pilus assembly protein [Marinobacter salicampi]|uniref:TrbC family F-type conjugative pilus assembly protein n=1 Tax=Marinobacter salicampi TaxID=435907 RepID=UPI00140C386D|nr:TrbC family F-type conjugative pilus assembly protein [Marinobacter salicampi]